MENYFIESWVLNGDIMNKCVCGNKINVNSIKNRTFWDEEYCSNYCRIFDERNMKKVNRAETVKAKGSKHYKNFSGFWDYPIIESECQCCGNKIELSKTESPSKIFCSKECINLIKSHPKSKKSHMVFTMFRVMRHWVQYKQEDEQWLNSNSLFYIMQRMGTHPRKNPYAFLLKIWASRGVLEMRDSNYRNERGVTLKIKEYRFNKKHLDVPLGKLFYQSVGLSLNK